MPFIEFPYGAEYLSCTIAPNRLRGVLTSRLHHYQPPASQQELVSQAMQNPIGSPRLRIMAQGKKDVVILASDHTRPVPSKIIIPELLREIRTGNPNAHITILIATGCHRGPTEEELRNKFGPDIMETVEIVVHDCDKSPVAYLGKLPSGGELFLNQRAVDADLLISEGFIEPHFFAGFSGGRKSVLPGIASRETVLYNHNAQFIQNPCSRTGVLLNNPIHADTVYAARICRLAFICNVVINANKEVMYAVAGDFDLAHQKGCAFLKENCTVQPQPADIVITTNGGYPLDQNIYQAVKGMTAAEAVVNEGGVILMIARSEDGHGGESFFNTFAEEKDLEKMQQAFLATPKEHTRVDQWQSQIFARVLTRAKVIYISSLADDIIREMHMIPAHSIAEGLQLAESLLNNPNASITAIPDGVGVIVEAN